MRTMTLEDFQTDPALRRRLFEMAHRERARAIYEGFASLGRGMIRLRDFVTPRPARWLERLG